MNETSTEVTSTVRVGIDVHAYFRRARPDVRAERLPPGRLEEDVTLSALADMLEDLVQTLTFTYSAIEIRRRLARGSARGCGEWRAKRQGRGSAP